MIVAKGQDLRQNLMWCEPSTCQMKAGKNGNGSIKYYFCTQSRYYHCIFFFLFYLKMF